MICARIEIGERKMNGSKLLSSFVNGFSRDNVSDIINAIYIAKSVFNVNFPFNFKSRGSRGVDSPEIRKLIFFSKYKIGKNHEKAFVAAEQLSKVDSKQLGWLAQYIMNGETHLYKEEAKKALKIQKSLSKSSLK